VNALPVVSVLMGVHNGLPYVGEAVASILGQTLRAIELVVVDDASDDGTSELLARQDDPRLVVLRNDHNVGLTQSLNRALATARGRYVARQDADDRSLPDRLERQVAFLERRPDIALCGTWARFIDAHGRLTAIGRPPSDPAALAATLRRGNVVFHGSIAARRDVVTALGGYRPAFRYAQDYDLYLRALERHRLANLPEPLYELRFHAAAISRAQCAAQTRFAVLARRLAEQRRERGSDDLDDSADVAGMIAAEGTLSELEHRRLEAMQRRLAGDLRGYRRSLMGLARADPRDPRHYAHLLLSLGGRRLLMAADRVAARRPSYRAPVVTALDDVRGS
jgi:glycosyltransferase involved in cell wall biosynthesis